jgi:hypothetical protein
VTSVSVPASLQPYIEYVTFGAGLGTHDGVELMLTKAGVTYARANHNRVSLELARWLMEQPLWCGHRTAKNVADEISTHALYVKWPLLGRRANPVNIEYFQSWPLSLVLLARDKLLSKLRPSRRN